MGAKFTQQVIDQQKKDPSSVNVSAKTIKGNDTAILEELIMKWPDEMIEAAIDPDGEFIKFLRDKDVKNIPEVPLDITDTIAEIRNDDSDKFEGIVQEIVEQLNKFAKEAKP